MTTIRSPESADEDHLRHIQQLALPEPSPELLEAGLEGTLPLFVAVEDGLPVGYVLAVTDGSDVVYLPEFAVHPDHQRSGHGTRLLRAVRERYPDRELHVTVRAVDDHARAFYESRGFERRERVADWFESGDGLVYVQSPD